MAQKAGHTPGPWGVAYLDSNGQAVVKAEHIEIATCWHHCVESIEKEMHANARLIAAAPDLLEALREAQTLAKLALTLTGCRSDDEYVAHVQQKIDAALTKAGAL